MSNSSESLESISENKKKYGYPHVLSVQNTKNARERANMHKLKIEALLNEI